MKPRKRLMTDQVKLKQVLDTYECLLSCVKSMPGMKLENAFSPAAILALEHEQIWLQSLLQEA